jgi:hypothetical protein
MSVEASRYHYCMGFVKSYNQARPACSKVPTIDSGSDIFQSNTTERWIVKAVVFFSES